MTGPLTGKRRAHDKIRALVAELESVKADRDDYAQRWLAECRAHGDTQRRLVAAHHELGDHSLCDGDCGDNGEAGDAWTGGFAENH